MSTCYACGFFGAKLYYYNEGDKGGALCLCMSCIKEILNHLEEARK